MRTRAKFLLASIPLTICLTALIGQTLHVTASTLLPAARQQAVLARASDFASAQAPGTRPDGTSAPATAQTTASSTIDVNAGRSSVNVEPALARRPGYSDTQTKSTQPKVIFDGGLLSIRARDSTLDDVLLAVQSATGATIDYQDAAPERVDVDLGPGRARDVLASLLDGSLHDYVLVGAQQEPDSVARIILTARRHFSGPPPTLNAAEPVQPPRVAPQVDASKQPARDMKTIMQQQQVQFEKQFGACIIQGCDAS